MFVIKYRIVHKYIDSNIRKIDTKLGLLYLKQSDNMLHLYGLWVFSFGELFCIFQM